MVNQSFFTRDSGNRFVTFLFVFFLFVGSFFVVNQTVPTSASSSSSISSSQPSLNHSFKLVSAVTSSSSTSSPSISSLSLRLDFSTFFVNSSGNDIITDPAGNVYVVGTTSSNALPVKNAYQATYGGGQDDAFVAKFNTSGDIVFCTYLGGSFSDEGSSIAVDPAGNIFVTGRTVSDNFPTKNAFDKVHTSGQYPDAFVAKFNATGSLLFSTFFGGSNNDGGNGIAVDSQGNCYITGPTSSSNFPLKNAYQTTFSNGYADIFIAKFNATGSLLFSTFFGGSNNDFSYSIAVDKAGNYFLTGTTSSTDFPTKNAFQSQFNTNQFNHFDAFVSEFNSTGSLVFSTYLGGSGMDSGESIAFNSTGTCFVTGTTQSSDFPLKNEFSTSSAPSISNQVIFITKFSPTGNLLSSSEVGSAYSSRIIFDSSGDYYITATTVGLNGDNNVFVAKFSPADQLLFSNSFGGSGMDSSSGIAVASSGSIYIAGSTASSDFPGLTCPNGKIFGTGFFYVLKLTLVQGSAQLGNTTGCVLVTPTASIFYGGPLQGVSTSILTSEKPTPGFSALSLGLILVLLPLSKRKFGLKKK